MHQPIPAAQPRALDWASPGGRSFTATERIGAQLWATRTARQQLAATQPVGRLYHSPSRLPPPYAYAVRTIGATFDRLKQSWSPAGFPRMRCPGGPKGAVVELAGWLPPGPGLLPMPLYSRLRTRPQPGFYNVYLHYTDSGDSFMVILHAATGQLLFAGLEIWADPLNRGYDFPLKEGFNGPEQLGCEAGAHEPEEKKLVTTGSPTGTAPASTAAEAWDIARRLNLTVRFVGDRPYQALVVSHAPAVGEFDAESAAWYVWLYRLTRCYRGGNFRPVDRSAILPMMAPRLHALAWWLNLLAVSVVVQTFSFQAPLAPAPPLAEAAVPRQRTARARRRLAEQYLVQAQRLMAAGRYKEAIELFRRSFRLRPSVLVMMALGQCHELAGELQEARAIYERLSRNPTTQALASQRLKSILERLSHRESPPQKPLQPPQKPPQPPVSRPQPTVAMPIPEPDSGEDKTEDLTAEADLAPVGVGADAGPGGPSPVEVSGVVGGWYRGRLSFDLAHDRALGSTDIPEYVLETRNELLLRLDIRYGARLHGFASVYLEHALREEPPDQGLFWIFNGRALRSEFQASIVEGYLSVAWEKLEVRLGMLRVPWGKSDYVSPNDIVNPRDLRDPLLADLETLRIPVLAAELGVQLGPVSLDLIWQPFASFDRMALYGNDFAISGPNLPRPFRGLVRYVSKMFDSTLTSKVEQVLISTALPPDDLTASSGGLRFAAKIGGVDLTAYYHFGWDSSPRLEMNPVVAQMMGTLDWDRLKAQDLSILLTFMDAGQAIYKSTYLRRHHAGLDIATTVGSFSLRGEVGFDSDRIFYDPNLNSHVMPAIAANVGAEFQRSLEKIILLEVNYLHLFERVEPLLFYDQDSISIGGMLRWAVLDDKLQGEVRAYFGIKPWAYIVRPQVSYKISRRWSVFVGALILGGNGRSLGGYFDRNDLVEAGAICNI